MMPVEVLKGWKLGELEKYVTASWMVGNTNTFYVVMNLDKWNKLPDDLKKIFDEVGMSSKRNMRSPGMTSTLKPSSSSNSRAARSPS